MSKEYKPGDVVWITEEGRDYNGPYAGTEGIVIKVLRDCVVVETYDGQTPWFPEKYIMHYEDYLESIMPKLECECGLKGTIAPPHAHYTYCPLYKKQK